jgi:hypothetical protein
MQAGIEDVRLNVVGRGSKVSFELLRRMLMGCQAARRVAMAAVEVKVAMAISVCTVCVRAVG